ncbi:glycoside hydrolase family 127 protein [Olivibacter ginsenosidimutans]|uniref:Glycoside hydrolase family 127 protein n=1 Tax=Olivibacter ginsenosidimutans TaxID=1176537 RepID=A0ABP9C3P2_9SPHI
MPQTSEKLTKVDEATAIKATVFPLQEVQLLESSFYAAQEGELKFLRWIEPDRLLAGFRQNAGLEPKAKRYGGWESEGLAGHSLGHYLSAISLHYASSQDTAFLSKINYVVAQLAETQKARKTGYIGAIPEEDRIWAEVAKGDIRTHSFDLNGGWAPWYTIHKIMAGLLDAYIYAGNKQALEVNLGLANWADKLLKNLNEAQIQEMLKCEYGGMAETLANTYALTGDKKYLELSYKFYDKPLLDALAHQQDVLPGKHANTIIPKAIASARRYELTGDNRDLAIADFFWKTVVNHHSYATGGNSNYEYFGPADQLNNTLTDNTTETCNSYNMLKLTQHLFMIKPSAALMDYYERDLLNHILASQNPNDGTVTYYTSLRMGGRKEFSDYEHAFTCCVGTGMENHVKYNQTIYFKGSDGSLFVNLFIPAVLTWKDEGLTLRQETRLPASDKVYFTIESAPTHPLPIRIRKPHWAQEYSLSINGKAVHPSIDEFGYIYLDQQWKADDQLVLTLKSSLYTESMPDNPDRQAIFYGPVLLAAKLGMEEPDPLKGTPVLVSDQAAPEHWIQAENKHELRFSTRPNVAYPQRVELMPFNHFVNEHYTVYWDIFTPEKWKEQQQVYEAENIKQRALEARTLSLFRPGEMQPERDHKLQGEKLTTGEDHQRKWRATQNGGYLTFEMAVDPQMANSLILSYWGMDNRGRIFDILIDGEKIAQEDLNNYKESRFYDITYAIPRTITKGKKQVIVTLKPTDEQNMAGPFYGARSVSNEK